MIDPVSAMTMYDAISDFAKKHGINLDEAVKSLISSYLKHPGQVGTDDLSGAWDAATVEDALKKTPYEDGDLDPLYEEYEEDINGDGDVDVTKMDTTGDGEIDTVAVTADSKKEEKDADKLAQDIAGDELTSTGKTDDELEENLAEEKPEKKDGEAKSKWREMLEMLVPGLPGFHGNI